MEKVFSNNLSIISIVNRILVCRYLPLVCIGLVILLDIGLYIVKGELRYVQAVILLSSVPIFFLLFFQLIGSKINFVRCNAINKNISSKNILFIFLFVSGALASLIMYPISYSRSILFFILFSFAITILMWEIGKVTNYKQYKNFLLIIIFISLILRIVPMSMIPGLYYDDPAFHEGFANEIILTGQVPSDSSYTNFPLMHILEAVISKICMISFKEAIIFSITALQAGIIPLFIFLIGKWTFDKSLFVDGTQVGLFAALFFAISDIPIRYGIMGAFPTNFAIIVSIMFIYLVLAKRGFSVYILLFILLVALILSHSLSSIVLLMILFIFVFLIYVNKFLFSFSIEISLSCIFLIMSFIVTFAYIMYASSFHFSKLVNMIFFQDSGVIASFSTKGGLSYSQIIPTYEYFLNALPQILLVSIALVGVFFILLRMNSFPKAALIIGISLILFAFGAFGLVFGLGNAPDRFIYYSFLFLPIASAFGLVLLFNFSNAGKILFVIIIITLPFLMISDSVSNNDSPIYTKNLTPQRFITESETISLETIFRVSEKPISADNDIYYFQMKYLYSDKIDVVNFYILSNLINHDDIIVRSFYCSRPIYSKGLYRINCNVDRKISETHSKVFNSNSIRYFFTS